MKIENIEFTAPSKLAPVGQLSFQADLVVTSDDFSKSVSDEDAKDIQLSDKTVELFQKLKLSLLNDITS